MLKDGPIAHKVASYIAITDRHTGEIHHHALQIENAKKVGGRWTWDEKQSIILEDAGTDEIGKLLEFLQTMRTNSLPEETGRFIALRLKDDGVDPASVGKLLSLGDGSALISEIVHLASSNPDLLSLLVSTASADPDGAKYAAAALNIGRFRTALAEIREHMEANADEHKYQKLLEEHPWMFGSEYSELLDERRITRNDQQDFVLRCTVDGYLETIEIKTTLGGAPLFLKDGSHKTLYPRRELSEAISQVMSYLEEIDDDRLRIQAKDREDACKIRAKIIIGRDTTPKQTAALRRFNAHLHRIEIMTFDQLAKIAEQVLKHLDHAVPEGAAQGNGKSISARVV